VRAAARTGTLVLLAILQGCQATVPGRSVSPAALATAGRQALPPTAEELGALSRALAGEDWDTAARTSRDLLRRSPDDGEDAAAIRYMFLFALAGQVASGHATQESLAREGVGLIGRRVRMPSYPIATRAHFCFDCLLDGSDDGQPPWTTVFAAQANRDGSTIYLFENVRLRSRFEPGRNDRRLAHASGTLRQVLTNPTRSRAWVARLVLDDGVVTVDD
jgi:hypothetical protein